MARRKEDEMDEIMQAATEAYLNDAEFHAKVYRAVALLDDDYHRQTGERMTKRDRHMATHAAAMALVINERVATR